MPLIAHAGKRRHFETAVHWALAIVAACTVLLLAGIFLFLFDRAFVAFREIPFGEFFLGTSWNPTSYHAASWGMGALLAGSLIISLLSLGIAVPLGLCIAIHLSEFSHFRTREFLKPAVELIAGIPTVVLGLLGLLFLAPVIASTFGLSNGLNALTASILVGIAALPTLASICEDALSSVPQRYREASLALGASKWMTIRRVVIPAARSGIAAAIMLGLGRVIGETIVVLMVAGNSLAFPMSVLDPARPITANIAIEIKEVVIGSLHWHSLFALGTVLFLLTFVLNFAADLLIHRKSS